MTAENKITFGVLALAGTLMALLVMTIVPLERQNDELRAQHEAHRLEIKELREAMAFVEQQGN